jgi:hypothetical protein
MPTTNRIIWWKQDICIVAQPHLPWTWSYMF